MSTSAKPSGPSLLIRSSGSAHPPQSGDFGAAVRDGALFVPADVFTWLEGNQVRTADVAVALLHTFPDALAAELGWSVEELLQARAQLFQLLKPHVPEELLSPSPPPRRGFGARKR